MAQSGVAMDSFVQRAIVAAIETEALETTMALLEAREGALDKLPRAFFGAAAKIIDDSCTRLSRHIACARYWCVLHIP
jgi:hypothetical protein